MAKDPTTGTRATKTRATKTAKPKARKPTAAQSKLRVGKVEEDGSFRVKGGGVWDPDTGKVRPVKTTRKR